MPRAFSSISFSDSVKTAQTRYGSRDQNQRFEYADDPRNTLTEREIRFIESRDSFYQASVSETGWPYVQHRGGPAGFLRVLDSHTIGYGDFKGNQQYISTGNINAHERIALILMDYPNRHRLKLWGRARIIHETEAPELIARLKMPDYHAQVERGIIIHIEAVDWNCTKHIIPRYTETEVARIMAPIIEENRQLREQSGATDT